MGSLYIGSRTWTIILFNRKSKGSSKKKYPELQTITIPKVGLGFSVTGVDLLFLCLVGLIYPWYSCSLIISCKSFNDTNFLIVLLIFYSFITFHVYCRWNVYLWMVSWRIAILYIAHLRGTWRFTCFFFFCWLVSVPNDSAWFCCFFCRFLIPLF